MSQRCLRERGLAVAWRTVRDDDGDVTDVKTVAVNGIKHGGTDLAEKRINVHVIII